MSKSYFLFSKKTDKKNLVIADYFPYLYGDITLKQMMILYFCADHFFRNTEGKCFIQYIWVHPKVKSQNFNC